MNEDREIIEGLKNNVKGYFSLSKGEKEILQYVKENTNHLMVFRTTGWEANGKPDIQDSYVYRISPDYNPEPEAEEFLEFEIKKRSEKLQYSTPCHNGYGGSFYYNIESPPPLVYIKGKEYLFIGYMFDGDDCVHSDWIAYKIDKGTHLYADTEQSEIKRRKARAVFANKVVYQLVKEQENG